MEQPFRTWVQAYIALSGASVLASREILSLPEILVPVLFVLFGPSASLLWGIAGAPIFAVTTVVWVVAVVLAVLAYGRWTTRAVATAGALVCGVLWLGLGWWAWALTF